MARLKHGENEHIDNINHLVQQVVEGIEVDASMAELLEIFNPLILKLCSKWAKYFRDEQHKMISFDNILADARSWMLVYTINKYTIDGEATYNSFIKSHLDSRIRYIYEKELNYRSKHIFPDPDKHGEKEDMFDQVVMTYGSDSSTDESDIILSAERQEWLKEASNAIYKISEDHLNSREREIFNRCIVNGESHIIVADSLEISRSRVSQIVCKIKKIIKHNIESDYWRIFDYGQL